MRTVAQENASSYIGLRAAQVPALPPWDERRDWLRITEVPAFLKRLYGIAVAPGTVANWYKRGVEAPTPSDPKRRIYLVTERAAGYRMVSKSDLLAFLNLE